MWNYVVLLLSVLPWIYCQEEVRILPSGQKVSEHSHVLFTCISPDPNVTFIWEMNRKSVWSEITNGQDSIELSEIGDTMSTLEIPHANVKKHKRLYRCNTISKLGGDDVRTSDVVKLRIARVKRLPKMFPILAPIRTQDDILIPSQRPNTVAMQCRMMGAAVRGATWRWIKDGNIELAPGNTRIDVESNGILRIRDITKDDSGNYTCVVTTKHGTAYGTPFTLNVKEAEQDNKCRTRDGVVLDIGQEYNPNNDPCNTCECTEGNRLVCRMVACLPPQCGERGYMQKPGTCCEFTCNGDEPKTVVEPGSCVGRSGVRVNHGDLYVPTADPCLKCRCENGQKGPCVVMDCPAPTCRNFTMSRDTCCQYSCHDAQPAEGVPVNEAGMCTDRDGRKVRNGEMYLPDEDPCKRCFCNHGNMGRCMMVACMPPTCKEYVTLPDKCCEFKCLDGSAAEVPPPLTEARMCTDRDGRKVRNGEMYLPKEDPCVECLCNRGYADTCRSVMCKAPTCQEYVSSRDKCCEYTCLNRSIAEVAPPLTEAGMCTDRDGRKVRNGEMYLPDEDPCKKCVCNQGNEGRCMSVRCRAPTCKDYVSSRDTCCGYTCLNRSVDGVAPPLSVTGQCKDNDGNMVSNGTIYQPNDNPCETCMCVNGRAELCAEAVCDAPPCPNYVLIEGSCCGFICNDTDYTGYEPGMCTDRDGRKVRNGEMYLPDEDPCKRCLCNDGNMGRCMMVTCRAPTCKEYVSSPDKCCEYTCLNRSVDGVAPPLSATGQCRDNDGNMVSNGTIYQPNDNPCETCMCVNGRAELCSSAVCDAPPCPIYVLIEGTCCGFICNDTAYAIPVFPGRAFIQQVGARSALVQWEYPDKDFINRTLTTVEFQLGTNSPPVRMVETRGSSVLVTDLDPNTPYKVNVTFLKDSMRFTPKGMNFSLDGRATNSLRLNDAIGELFESRGAMVFPEYSLPRRFNRVVTDAKFVVSVNTVTFHRSELAFYDQAPCPKLTCGMIRFYIYGMDGTMKNVMSLLFTDDRDFEWAKAHL